MPKTNENENSDSQNGETTEEVVTTEDKSTKDNSEKTEREKDLEAELENSQAEIAKYKRMAKQKSKKAEKAVEESTETKSEETTESKQDRLDYGQKAYLLANNIKGAEEFNLVESIMEDTGKSLEDVVESSYFKHELKELREDSSTKEAMPKSSTRAKSTAKDKVDYWVAKGELPPNTPENTELRRQVVNAKTKKESGSKFADIAVVQ